MGSILVPAAQYLRMSTDHQQYSLQNQADAISRYANQHGFQIVKTYSDGAKSGVRLKYREGLKRLLTDVVEGQSLFRTVLVYDVSRWGRFLDVDESAHYEFICKQCNIPLHYCAESFANDNSLSSSIFKALKRTMAAEYSRELSEKVSQGLKRLSALGFRTTGTAGYGLRRMLVSADGYRKQILHDGERKSIATDRIILVPGPKREVERVREIFDMYAHKRMGVAEIVRNLTNRGIPFPIRGRRWNPSNIIHMLKNPKYVGTNAWGRTSKRLKTARVYDIAPSAWVVKENAFQPIIERTTFDKVQRIFGRRRSRNYWYSEQQMLWKLKNLKRTKGKITRALIDATPGPNATTYACRFGSLLSSYKRAAYDPPTSSQKSATHWNRSNKLRRMMMKEITQELKGRASLCGSRTRRIPFCVLTTRLISSWSCAARRKHRLVTVDGRWAFAMS